MNLRKCIMLKAVKNIKPIVDTKSFTKPNCNVCMEERLTILKNLRDKRVTFMNKKLKVYRDFRHYTIIHRFFLSIDDFINL